MRVVVRCTDPTHPDNCLNIIFASRTFFISKLPHRVDTFRRMGQQESDTYLVQNTCTHSAWFNATFDCWKVSDIHVPEKLQTPSGRGAGIYVRSKRGVPLCPSPQVPLC